MTYDLTPVYRTDRNLGESYETSLAWAKERRTVDELLALEQNEGIRSALSWIQHAETLQMTRERNSLLSRNSVAVAKGIKKGTIKTSDNPSSKYGSESLISLARLEIVLTAFGAVPEDELKLNNQLYEKFEEAKRLKTREENHLRRLGFLGEDIGRLIGV